MLTEGLVYSQMHKTAHLPAKAQKDTDYYRQKCKTMKARLRQFEDENERLIEENCYLLDKNYQYSDTISVMDSFSKYQSLPSPRRNPRPIFTKRWKMIIKV